MAAIHDTKRAGLMLQLLFRDARITIGMGRDMAAGRAVGERKSTIRCAE
jgi:hypothetical protein